MQGRDGMPKFQLKSRHRLYDPNNISPSVAGLGTLGVFPAIAASPNLETGQTGVSTAFSNTDIKENIVFQPD